MLLTNSSPPLKVGIRPAVPGDHLALTDLFFEFYTVFNLKQTVSGLAKELLQVDNAKAFAKDTITSYFDNQDIIFVAEIDNQLVGYISGNIQQKDHYIFSPEAEIIDWFVTSTFRGSGIGKKLYQAFLDSVKAQECKAITLEAFYQNTPTIETYERMGFVRDSLILKKKI